jgi:hypothetical protein
MAGTKIVASVPSSTTFTVTGTAGSLATGTVSYNGQSNGGATTSSADGTYVTYTTTSAHGYVVGQDVTVTAGTAALNLANQTIIAVPSSTTFIVANGVGAATGTGHTVKANAYATTTDVPVGILTNGTTNVVTLPDFSAKGYQRIDVLAIDLTTLALAVPSATNGLKGAEVAIGTTTTVPNGWDASRYVAIATVQSAAYASVTPVSQPPVDARNVTEFVPQRAYNRSQNVRINGKKIGPTGDTFVNIEDPSSRKELSYHSAIGAVYSTGGLTLSTGDYVVHTGCQATGVGTGVVTFTGGEIYNRVTNSYIALPGGAAFAGQTAPGATTTRIDLYVADRVTGVISVIKGSTAANAGTVGHQALQGSTSLPAVPADKLGLCYAILSGSGPNVDAIRDIRPRP